MAGEFETGGHTYRVDKMNAREQLHLMRGLGPLFGPMVQLAMVPGGPAGMDVASRQLGFMLPFFDAFADMEEDKVNILVNKCLSVTRRREGSNGSTTWSPPMWNAAAGREQYTDLTLADLMAVCWNVIQENLGGFFDIGSVASTSDTGTTPTETSPGLPSLTMKTS
jgi:hypothetical protein